MTPTSRNPACGTETPLSPSSKPYQAGEKPASLLSDKLYSTRDVMRRFWGDRYAGRIAELTPILQAVMKNRRCEVLPALNDILETMQRDPETGMQQGLMIAAAVEVIETS